MKLELKKIFIVFQFFCLTLTQASEPKTLELEVLNRLEEPSDEGSVEVSNLKKIEIKLSLKKPVAETEELPIFSEIKINPDEKKNLKHWLEVSAIFLSDGNEAEVLTSLCNNKLPAGQTSFDLHFIQDSETIEGNISRYLKNLKDSTKDRHALDPSAENKMRLDILNAHENKKESIIEIFKRYYFENRLGTYEVKIAYCFRDSNGQEMRIESSLPNLEVKNLGDCLCEIFEHKN